MCPATTPGGAPGNFYSFAENTLKNRKLHFFSNWNSATLDENKIISR